MRNTSPVQTCRHCGQRTDRWLWRLIESYPEHMYEKLCDDCCQQQDATFTAEQAIFHAIIIIGIRQGSWTPAILPRQIGGAR